MSRPKRHLQLVAGEPSAHRQTVLEFACISADARGAEVARSRDIDRWLRQIAERRRASGKAVG